MTVGKLTPGIAGNAALATFNGTSVVTVTMVTGFGTLTCHFDLANPAAPSSCS